jgi:hypothetical protein
VTDIEGRDTSARGWSSLRYPIAEKLPLDSVPVSVPHTFSPKWNRSLATGDPYVFEGEPEIFPPPATAGDLLFQAKFWEEHIQDDEVLKRG